MGRAAQSATSENSKLCVTPFAEMRIYIGMYGRIYVFALLGQTIMSAPYIAFGSVASLDFKGFGGCQSLLTVL